MRHPALTALALTGILVVGTACTQVAAGPSRSTTTDRSTTPVAPTTTSTPPTTGAPPPPTTAAPPPATTPAPPPTTPGLRVGPGPQATYTVEPQPAPGTCHYTYLGPDPLPDPNCTPGAISPQVTQADIGTTICSSGYTSTIRPPEDVTEPEKEASAAAYDYTGPFSTAEYDHLVPLELGGDPNDPANLWVEPNDIPGATSVNNTKDLVENRLNALVCSGQLSLAVAQQAIASNWVAAYRTYGGQ